MNYANLFIDSVLVHTVCGPQQVDKALNSLAGLIEGILADEVMRPGKIIVLKEWLTLHQHFEGTSPFSAFLPGLKAVIAGGEVDSGILEDIAWLCHQFHDVHAHYGQVTSSIQELHGICHGILADGKIRKKAVISLSDWLYSHKELNKSWPYEGLCHLVACVLDDGIIYKHHHRRLKRFFWEFVETDRKKVIYNPPALIKGKLQSVCSLAPEIEFTDKRFCFTGQSARTSRPHIAEIIDEAGGLYSKDVSPMIDYLIICDEGSSNWAFPCYGRKVVQAVNLRKQGKPIVVFHENDLWNALANKGMAIET